MHFRVSVNFTGGCLQNFRSRPFCQTEHIYRPVNAGFDGLHRVFLVMYRGGGTGEIVYFVALNIERKSHIVADEFKLFIIEQMVDIAFCAGEKIVCTNNFIPLCQKCFAQMGTEKTAAAGDKDTFHNTKPY